MAASIASLIFSFTYTPIIFLACQFFSEIGWALIGGGLLNYLPERVPPDELPAHLARINITVNLAVRLCGLVASPIASSITLFMGLLLAILLRFLAGLAIFSWG